MSGPATNVAYLTTNLKMPGARRLAPSLAEPARDEGWEYLEFLANVLSE